MDATISGYVYDGLNGATRFVTSRDGKRLVLKPLPDDCVIANAIHPNIKERLHRIRELPVTHVSDLLGVERVAGGMYLVWSFIDGLPVERWLSESDRDESVRKRVYDEVALIVENLHAHGIVHGSVHAGNVIVDDAGAVSLTHASPYLYDDRAADHIGLAHVAAALRLIDPASAAAKINSDESRPVKTRSRTLAWVFALVGVALAVAVWLIVRSAGA